MTPADRLVRTSRFLSLVLRHDPGAIGLGLDEGGWVGIDDLLAAARAHGTDLSRELLEKVVATSDKRRFALSPDGTRIRASQGHSVPVDLGLEPLAPPDTLFHGTSAAALPAIRREGLHKRARHHVHLSADPQTATAVGRRHGPPVVLAVDAAAMARDGLVFFRSVNGVWLTEHVPPRYLKENTPT